MNRVTSTKTTVLQEFWHHIHKRSFVCTRWKDLFYYTKLEIYHLSSFPVVIRSDKQSYKWNVEIMYTYGPWVITRDPTNLPTCSEIHQCLWHRHSPLPHPETGNEWNLPRCVSSSFQRGRNELSWLSLSLRTLLSLDHCKHRSTPCSLLLGWSCFSSIFPWKDRTDVVAMLDRIKSYMV